MTEEEGVLHPSFKRACFCRPFNIPRTKPTPEVQDILKDYQISDDQLKLYMKKLMADIRKGLAKATHPKAIVKCFVSYIQDLPTGQETGKCLAVDFGGTNFRCSVVDLQQNHFEMMSRSFAIPSDKMVGPGKDFFDFMVSRLHNFLIEQKLEDQSLPFGYTFSYPLQQKALDKGILERWTKGIKLDDVVGKDVVQIFQDALIRRGIQKNVKIKVILNDTCGCLIAGAWRSPYCKIGLIIGTGTNACYVEKQSNAELFDSQDHGSGIVLINCEWGAFGDDGSLDYIRSLEDKEIDQTSLNPGKQLHEKMISGMYMGELVRLCILKCVKAGALFGGKASSELNRRDRFLAKYVSDIESDQPGTFDRCKKVFEEMGLKATSDDDYRNVRYICESVSRRAASLVAAGLCTLIKKTEEKRITVAIEGSVYQFHPHFHNLLMEKMKKFVKPGVVFDLMLSEDGGSKGAALAAAAVAESGSRKSS